MEPIEGRMWQVTENKKPASWRLIKAVWGLRLPQRRTDGSKIITSAAVTAGDGDGGTCEEEPTF